MLLLVLHDAISVYLGEQGVYTVALVTVSEAPGNLETIHTFSLDQMHIYGTQQM